MGAKRRATEKSGVALVYVHSPCNAYAALRMLEVRKFAKVCVILHRGATWPAAGEQQVVLRCKGYVLNDLSHLQWSSKFLQENKSVAVFLPHSWSVLSYYYAKSKSISELNYLDEGVGTYTASYDSCHATSYNRFSGVKPYRVSGAGKIVRRLRSVLSAKGVGVIEKAAFLRCYIGFNFLYGSGFLDLANKKVAQVWMHEELAIATGKTITFGGVFDEDVTKKNKALFLMPSSGFDRFSELFLILERLKSKLEIDGFDYKYRPGHSHVAEKLNSTALAEEICDVEMEVDVAVWAQRRGYKALVCIDSSAILYGAVAAKRDCEFRVIDLYRFLYSELSPTHRFLAEINSDLANLVASRWDEV